MNRTILQKGTRHLMDIHTSKTQREFNVDFVVQKPISNPIRINLYQHIVDVNTPNSCDIEHILIQYCDLALEMVI